MQYDTIDLYLLHIYGYVLKMFKYIFFDAFQGQIDPFVLTVG